MTDVTNVESFQPPAPTNLERDSIFDIAEKVASKLNYSPGDNLYEIVEDLGGEVCLKDFWSEGSKEGGSLEVRSRDDFTIFVPVDTSEIRDRFTIAHELGHYFLHYLWPLQVLQKEPFKLRASRYGSDRGEWEANWFASAFLMPCDEFKSKMQDEAYSIESVAKYFSVSPKAVEIRAEVLELNVRPCTTS